MATHHHYAFSDFLFTSISHLATGQVMSKKWGEDM
jgi:hypothetical protein